LVPQNLQCCMLLTSHSAAILSFLLWLAGTALANPILFSGQNAFLEITQITDDTVRVTLKASDGGSLESPVLTPRDWPAPALKVTELNGERTLRLKRQVISLKPSPLTIKISTPNREFTQQLVFDDKQGSVTFRMSDGPVLGLGGGGSQFDRKGSFDPMTSGHRAGEYQIFGSRVPIPFVIGTEGWGLFFHRPYNGSFDFRGKEGRFQLSERPDGEREQPLPLDFFVIGADSPLALMKEYGVLTGKPPMPPKWSLGYIQSHRTLAGPDEILDVAQTFRRKGLPCDTLIYLGTGYCPAGWNTGHGSIEFNPATFDKPKELIDRLHQQHFKVILHVNQAPKNLHGQIPPAAAEELDSEHIANYWLRHEEPFALGVDGWWPDDGDELPIDARLARHRAYHYGPLKVRPGERPFSLHRTGYAGMQRYGGWVWSGDVYSLWDTLAAHVPIGINFSLSASPYWGSDTGGFFSTSELTGELYVRWFQFSSFTPIFRSHGRAWHTRLPWGWNTGTLGPAELPDRRSGTAAPDERELHNPEVEPICSKYLNLRYQLMPYLYTLAREATDSGVPIMRAMWLHYPEDPRAVRRGDQYLWGPNMLVAPVVQKGVTHRKVYLPRGMWYDFWTQSKIMGEQEITRYVDLGTMPLYVRAGAILPMDPVRQYVEQLVEEPTTLNVYTGSDGEFVLYEDDGTSLRYQQDIATWTRLKWDDVNRILTIEPDRRSTMDSPAARRFDIFLVPEKQSRSLTYEGQLVKLKF
jgi:alpha-glucosidase (family GH31 glycosyl hydrolase)